MYPLFREFLFCLPPELAHRVSMDALKWAHHLGFLSNRSSLNSQPVDLMGLRFPNRVGLAAGLDKNGEYIEALAKLGFGFIEIGTVTPRPQAGNPKPRVFRLRRDKAIINRLGFNNKGVDYLVKQVLASDYQGILGINIGKNKDTSDADALRDYLTCIEAVYHCADYITINVSSPNTPGLRNLQYGDHLLTLLHGVKSKQREHHMASGKYVPLVVKMAPDMQADEVKQFAQALIDEGIDGAIATNTTVSRPTLQTKRYASERGGLSGQPLFEKSNRVLSVLVKALNGRVPIIGVGGIASAEQAQQKLNLGADLVQLYSGLIYRGPRLVRKVISASA